VNSHYELESLCDQASELGLVHTKISDAGRTEVSENTYTVCGIGPDKASKIDVVTGRLKLL
jgi:peptidyl-tRNA hydrolase